MMPWWFSISHSASNLRSTGQTWKAEPFAALNTRDWLHDDLSICISSPSLHTNSLCPPCSSPCLDWSSHIHLLHFQNPLAGAQVLGYTSIYRLFPSTFLLVPPSMVILPCSQPTCHALILLV